MPSIYIGVSVYIHTLQYAVIDKYAPSFRYFDLFFLIIFFNELYNTKEQSGISRFSFSINHSSKFSIGSALIKASDHISQIN